MFYAYVVMSEKDGYLYKGHCSDLHKRLKQHNSGMTVSLRSHLPVKMVYYEERETLEEAIKRERFFKSAAGRRFLKDKLNGLVP